MTGGMRGAGAVRGLLPAALLALGAAQGCAAPAPGGDGGRLLLDAPVVRLPLREEPDNRFSVEVFLQGDGPFRFLLDSGAAITVLDPSVAQRFLAEDKGLPFRLRGALGGEPRVVPRGTIGEVSFQPEAAPGARIHDVPFLTQAVPHSFDGVAGMGLFRGCRVVFDFPSRFVEASRPRGARDRVLAGEGDLPTVILALEDSRVEAVVDTGFAGTLYLPRREASALRNLGKPSRIIVLADVHGTLPAEERLLRSELRAGSGSMTDPWVLVGEGGALLGNGFLRSWRVVFDDRGRFVDVEPPR